MSYIVTSNTPENDVGEQVDGLNRAFSYQNNLNDPLVIPKNAQIAVESVKINKSGNQLLSSANSTFAFYFGKELGNASYWYDSNSVAVPTSVRGLNQETFTSGNTNQIASAFQFQANNTIFHPNLCENASSGINPGATCIALRNASNLDFEGYQFSVTNPTISKNQESSASLVTADFVVANELIADITPSYNPGTGVLSNTGAREGAMICEKYPISLTSGSLTFTLVDQGGTRQRMGLTRSIGGSAALGPRPPQYIEDYYEDYLGDVYTQFYDYEAMIEDDLDGTLKIYQAKAVINADGSRELQRAEFDYTSQTGSALLTAKGNDIVSITFNIQNERVKLTVIAGGGASTFVLTDGTSTTNASNLKPINMNTRFLFPKVQLEAGKTIEISSFNGVDLKGGGAFLDIVTRGGVDVAGNRNFFMTFGSDVITAANVRDMDLFTTGAFDFTNQDGLTGNRLDIYPLLITAPSSLYKVITGNCNSARILGFVGRTLASPSTSYSGNNNLVWKSDEVPSLKNTNSYFVLIPNLTFNSTNMSVGRKSKLLYHIPAFSNNGESTGALFFQPGEKMYLDLNNVNEIYMNSLQVDIVRVNETLAEELQGKTTVCFHLRKKS